MNRISPLAFCALLAWRISALCAADVDNVRERLEKARAAYEAKVELLRKDVLEDLEKSEIAARKIPDKNRLDQIKTQRKAFQTSGELPASLNPQLLARIRGTRTAMEKEYLAARDVYLRTRQDEKAEAIDKELEVFRKGMDAAPQDLLKGIDLKRDTIRGGWQREGESLFSAGAGYSSIHLATTPPREYILEITVAKIAGNSDLQIGLITGQTRCTIVLDGWGGATSGISNIDGRSSNENETTHHGAVLVDAAAVVSIAVRKGQITVTVGNNPVIDWKGDEKRLTLGQDPAGIDPRFLFIAVQNGGRYRIDAIKLKPLTGEGSLGAPAVKGAK